MNVEEALRDALHQMSEETAEPLSARAGGMADRVLQLRRRRRAARVSGIVVTTAAVVAAAVVLPVVHGDAEGSAADRTRPRDVMAHPDQSPPRELIAAGRTAMSSYTALSKEKLPGGDEVLDWNWHMYDPVEERYEKTDWAWLDVAPGLGRAAVLEGPLPSERVGLLDTGTGEVTRWIELERPAASVSWSPDGTRLLATTYSKNPDRFWRDDPTDVNGKGEPDVPQGRTGYYLIDAASGDAHWTSLLPPEDRSGLSGSARGDLEWSWDGSHIFTRTTDPWSPKQFYDLEGRKAESPTGENFAHTEAGRSPSGRYSAGDFAGGGKEVATEVLDSRTGKRVSLQPVQRLLSWADDNHLIAWGCDLKKCDGKGEFRQQLVLTDVDGSYVKELTDFRTREGKDDWEPQFSPR